MSTYPSIQNSDRLIVVEGPIGVGKTSLARMLADRWNAQPVYETFEENPFLTGGFYQDKANYAFNTEIFFLLARFRQQLKLASATGPWVSDYFFEKNALFSELNLQPEDFETYQAVYKPFEKRIRTPDLVVYLNADVETLLQRVYLRDRQFERSISGQYLESLANAYANFFKTYDKAPVVSINTRGLDFVREPQHFARIVGMVEERLLGYRQLSLGTHNRSKLASA